MGWSLRLHSFHVTCSHLIHCWCKHIDLCSLKYSYLTPVEGRTSSSRAVLQQQQKPLDSWVNSGRFSELVENFHHRHDWFSVKMFPTRKKTKMWRMRKGEAIGSFICVNKEMLRSSIHTLWLRSFIPTRVFYISSKVASYWDKRQSPQTSVMVSAHPHTSTAFLWFPLHVTDMTYLWFLG